MMVRARSILIAQDNVDTDALYPGRFINIVDPMKAREHLFEGLDPSLRTLLGEGPSVLFVGDNFGSGSSREQPVSAMKAWDVRCVIGKSFARIFGRNAVNCGLPAFENPQAVAEARHGEFVEVDAESGLVRLDGIAFPSRPKSVLQSEILRAGGLVAWVRSRLATETGAGRVGQA